ncbi:YdcF family protein [Leptolyngbya sp. 7M]|uniref:YdcF family protein n=1 Tax=Leptolyngbya sp. 7M TaxID=2812896 RepID=UPI001CEDE641|nr:ElyC/SanA/YdcF family protein [Leptolyngbya sp. 7M]
MVGIFGMIPARLAIAYFHSPHPEAILVLGGNPDREAAAAQLANQYPELDIWVSSGELPQNARAIFATAGISMQRLHLDYRATDTVTNFTTLVPKLKQNQIQHIFLVTSDFHMPRAQAIATVVLGSQGIAFTSVPVPSDNPPEAKLRIARDVGRSVLWLATGRTGATIGSCIDSENVKNIENCRFLNRFFLQSRWS